MQTFTKHLVCARRFSKPPGAPRKQTRPKQPCSHEANILVERRRQKKPDECVTNESGDTKWEAEGTEAGGGHWGMLHLENSKQTD